MKVFICCNEAQKQEILSKQTNASVQLIFVNKLTSQNIAEADVVFDLLFDEFTNETINYSKPTFVNAVVKTCKELPNNCIRLNAWTGFLQSDVLEIATHSHQNFVESVMNALNWKFQFVADEPGMISARVIAMIVNEAYFALEDNVSTKEEIDIAMKLGTNYPFGPFEWSEKIGLKQINDLLRKLALQDTRYQPSNLLTNSIK